MKVLLDTNAFLAVAFDQKLPSGVRRLIGKQTTEMLISIVTPWEIAIKSSCLGTKRGGLAINRRHIDHAIEAMGARLLPVTLDHTEIVANLPLHHGDPFDRMIIAQALDESCPVLSSDGRFPAYEPEGLRVIWN